MAGEGLLRRERLKGQAAIQRVIAAGRTVEDRLLVIHYLASEDGSGRRFAVGISRGMRSAVQRNLLRRRIREIWRTKRARLPLNGDFVIIARRHARAASFTELSRSFDRLSDALVD